jgi:PIN domain nuclease of toxin-antitoxin system
VSACVIDASAALAYLFGERGGDEARLWMDRGAAISTANVQEVIAKLVDRGTSREDAAADVELLALEVAELTFEDAVEAGALIALTKPHGLSAGDRCCLALGRRLGVPVVHAEQRWQALAREVGVELVLVREAPEAG